MANTFITPTVYAKKFLRNYDLATVVADLVNTTYQGDLAEFGDSVHVQKLGNVTISNYTVGSDITAQDLTITDQTLSVNQKKAAMAYIDAVEIRQSHLPLINGWMKRFSVGFAQAVDDRLLGHYVDVDAGNIIGTDAAPIALTKDNVYDYFTQAWEMLDADGVPTDRRVAVVDETVRTAIVRSSDYVKATSTGDEVVRKGMVGYLAGFRVVVSPRISTVSGVRHQMFFHPDFIDLVVQLDYKSLLQTGKAEKRFATYIKGLALYGSGVLQPTTGVVLKRAA